MMSEKQKITGFTTSFQQCRNCYASFTQSNLKIKSEQEIDIIILAEMFDWYLKSVGFYEIGKIDSQAEFFDNIYMDIFQKNRSKILLKNEEKQALIEIWKKNQNEYGILEEFILGAAIEQLLTVDLRKQTGAYYTPQNISHFITNQVLLSWVFKEPTNQSYLYLIPENYKQNIGKTEIERIKSLKILDPAVGSGHFIVQALKILIDLYKNSPQHPNNDQIFQYIINQILPDTLFATDINPIAVIVARIRIWMITLQYLSGSKKEQLIASLMEGSIKNNFTICNSLTYSWKEKFDIIIGNPPYGDLLEKHEKALIADYASNPKEVASVFIELATDIVRPGGLVGMIVTYAITFSKYLSETRNKLQNAFELIKIASFDRDKCRFFEGMTQSVSILFCFNKKMEESKELKGEIYTSLMFRKMPNLFEIGILPTNAFILYDPIKMGRPLKHRLPKLGESWIGKLIQKMQASSVSQIGDNIGSLSVIKEQKDHNLVQTNGTDLWMRISGNYWYNAWTQPPYFGTQIAKTKVNSEPYRDLILLIMNSSLFYLWFRVYSDGRHMNADILNAFPLPPLSDQKMERLAPYFKEFQQDLMQTMFRNFDKQHNRFLSSQFKAVLDEIDMLLGELYGFSPDEIDNIMNFEKEIRGGKCLSKLTEKHLRYLQEITEK